MKMGLLGHAFEGMTSLSPWARTPPAPNCLGVLQSEQLLISPREPGGARGSAAPL